MNAYMRRRAAPDARPSRTTRSTTLIQSDESRESRRPPIVAAAVVGAALALSACTSTQVAWLEDSPLSFMASTLTVSDGVADSVDYSDEQSPEDALGPDPQLAKAAPAPRARPSAPASRNGRDIRPAIAHPSTTPTPGRNRLNPNKLVGLDEREVIRLLGQPERVRSKPPATVWSYTVKKCTLDVFFYLDLASERFRVLAYEVNSTRGSEEMKRVCLGRIQSALRTN